MKVRINVDRRDDDLLGTFGAYAICFWLVFRSKSGLVSFHLKNEDDSETWEYHWFAYFFFAGEKKSVRAILSFFFCLDCSSSVKSKGLIFCC